MITNDVNDLRFCKTFENMNKANTTKTHTLVYLFEEKSIYIQHMCGYTAV